MTLHVETSADAVAVTAADLIARAIEANPALTIGLPTGRTPIETYARLRERSLDWQGVRVFMLDELVGLSGDDPRSYRAFIRRHLTEGVGVRVEHLHSLDGAAGDLDAECARYEQALRAVGGLDLLVCGLGANGHVAFNEPGSVLHADTHVATLLDSTRTANAGTFGGDASAVPARALTVGMGTFLRATRVVLLVTGAAKAGAVTAMVKGPLTTQHPASWLQLHPEVDVLLDAAAAAGV